MLTCAKCGSSVALPADPRALTAACGRCGSSVDLASMRTIADVRAETAPPDDLLATGRVLSGYRIEGLLGRGGMAAVYKATQLSLHRPVALKVLPRTLAQNPAFVARFNREAGALAALNHPNIINIIDRGVEGEIYFFVMEFVDGTDLQAVLSQGRPSPPESVRIAAQVCAALDYAHKRGVIHRDIKPGNIMIDRNGTVKVTDFGIAHLAGNPETSFGLTVAGAAMGTVNYMAPEQRTDARQVDARADLYALGVVLYEMLTGQIPLGAFEPPSRVNPEADPRLDAVVVRALKPNPKDRFAGAQEMASALSPLAGASVPRPTEAAASTPAPPSTLPCPQCQSENRADAKFCLNCGKTLIESCPKCRKSIRAGAKFCDACGTNIGQVLTQIRENLKTKLGTAAGLEKEHRLPEALSELETILAAEGPELEELKAKAQDLKRRVLDAKEKLDAKFTIGQEHYDRKDFESAVAQWKKLPPALSYVKEAIGEAQRKIATRDQALHEAETAHASGKFEEALAAWQRATELVADPAPYRAQMEEAREKVAAAKYLEANRRATQATATRDFAGAVSAWTEALKWRPDDPVAKAELPKAEILKRSTERDAWIAKGEQAMAAGRAKEAVDCWQKALTLLVPDHPQLRADVNARLQSARARQSQDQKKTLIIAGAAGGGLLFLILLVVAIVLIANRDNKPSPGGGGGGTPPPVPGASNPAELFEKARLLIGQQQLEPLYGLHCDRYRNRTDFPTFVSNMKKQYFPYNQNGFNPQYMQFVQTGEQGGKTVIYWAYPGRWNPVYNRIEWDGNIYSYYFPVVQESNGWKFDP